jgi:hypothetical protein
MGYGSASYNYLNNPNPALTGRIRLRQGYGGQEGSMNTLAKSNVRLFASSKSWIEGERFASSTLLRNLKECAWRPVFRICTQAKAARLGPPL